MPLADASHPVAVPIPRDQGGIVSCVSSAAYYQRVTLTYPDGSTVDDFGSLGR